MEITDAQYALLEQYHGAGNIIVLSVGKEDFAFRRPEQTQITYAIDCIAKKMPTAREQLALGCLVTAAAPSAGVIGVKPTAEDKGALDAEKALLGGMLEAAQSFRDDIATQFAWAIGSSPTIVSCESIGGERYKVLVGPNPDAVEHCKMDWGPIELVAHKPVRAEYEKFRLLNIQNAEGEAEQYIYDKLVESSNKAEFARMYPLAVIALGNFLPTLGTDGRSVRIKKFKGGSQTEVSISTDTPAPVVTSP